MRFQHVLHPEHPKQWFSSVKKASETLYIYAKNRALCFRGLKNSVFGVSQVSFMRLSMLGHGYTSENGGFGGFGDPQIVVRK